MSISAKSQVSPPKNAAPGMITKVEVVTSAPVPEGLSWKITGAHQGMAVAESLVLGVPKFTGNDGGLAKFEMEAMIAGSGDAKLGAFQIVSDDGSVVIDVAGTSLGTVSSILAKEEAPLWTLPPLDFGGVNWWLLGPLVLVFISAAAWGARAAWIRWLRKDPSTLNPRDKALLRLSQAVSLAKGDRLEPEAGRRIGFEVTGLVREYASARFGLEALESTDHEFLRQLEQQQSVGEAHKRQLRSIFENFDVVKYGNAPLDAKRLPDITRSVREFLNATWIEEPKK